MMKDPIGPGTKAWDSFDNAVDAYRVAKVHNSGLDKNYKRYSNCRALMIVELRRHVSEKIVQEWIAALRGRCQELD